MPVNRVSTQIHRGPAQHSSGKMSALQGHHIGLLHLIVNVVRSSHCVASVGCGHDAWRMLQHQPNLEHGPLSDAIRRGAVLLGRHCAGRQSSLARP